MKLREYEIRAVREVPRLLVKHKRVLLVGPTGSGKTVAAAHLLKSPSLRNKRVLWVAHRKELLTQARRQLLAAGYPAGDIRMLTGSEKTGNVGAFMTLASVQILGDKYLPEFDVLVIDEAHRALAPTYVRLIRDCGDGGRLVLGLTATPWRLDGRGLKDVFDHMFVMAITSELIADKHIAAPRTFGVPLAKAKAMTAGVRIKAGDFDERQLSRAMRKRTLMGDTVAEHARLALGRATIVYAVDRRHAKALERRFKAAGRVTAYLDGQTHKDERARIIAGLSSGKIEVVVSVDVITEGLDVPRVKCIVMCRPTKSLTVYLQQAGRASRPWGNMRPVILDHAGNVWRHRLPGAEREWTLEPHRSRHGGGCSNDGGRHCAACGTMNDPDATVCAECGADLGPTERDRSLAEDRARQLEELRESEAEKARREKVIREFAKVNGWDAAAVSRLLVAAQEAVA